MAKRKKLNPADYIIPIDINDMHGRMIRVPAPKGKRREILIVYGLHASIERMTGFIEDLSQYGAVTLVDLPGYGGMDTFYKIGEKPTLDNMADYLASFIKLRYKRKRFTIIAMSFGFTITTRMLQKYPDIAKNVDLLVSLVGFVHKDDFRFNRRNYYLLRTMATVFSRKYPALFVQKAVLRGPFIRFAYKAVADKNSKLKGADETEQNKRIDFEIGLWKSNDIRTQMHNGVTMLTADLCNDHVDLAVYHVTVDNDMYFDNNIVEQHLNIIFNKVVIVPTGIDGHAPTVVAEVEDVAPLMPQRLRRLLAKQK